jgi:hypothetical protein
MYYEIKRVTISGITYAFDGNEITVSLLSKQDTTFSNP